MTTYAQGGFMPGYPVGWHPATSLGMPPEFFIPSTVDDAERIGSSTNGPNQHVGFRADTSSAKFGDADTANVSYRGSRVKITSP